MPFKLAWYISIVYVHAIYSLYNHFLYSQSDMAQVVEKQVIKQMKKDRMRKSLPVPSCGKSPKRKSNSNLWFFGSSRTDT